MRQRKWSQAFDRWVVFCLFKEKSKNCGWRSHFQLLECWKFAYPSTSKTPNPTKWQRVNDRIKAPASRDRRRIRVSLRCRGDWQSQRWKWRVQTWLSSKTLKNWDLSTKCAFECGWVWDPPCRSRSHTKTERNRRQSTFSRYFVLETTRHMRNVFLRSGC